MTKNFCLIVLLGLASLNLLQASNLRYNFDLSTITRTLQQAALNDQLDAVWNNVEEAINNPWLNGEDWQAVNEESIIPVVNDVNNAVPSVTDTIQNASDNLAPDTANAVDAATLAVTDAVTSVLAGAGTSVDEVSNAATDAWNNNGGDQATDLANGDLNDAAQAAAGTAADLTGTASPDDLNDAANNAASTSTDEVNNAVNVITDAVNQGLDNAGVSQDEAASQAATLADAASQQAGDAGVDLSGFSNINSAGDVTADNVNDAINLANNVDVAQATDNVNGAINDASVNSQPGIQDTANTVAAVADSINQNSDQIGDALNAAAASLGNPLDQSFGGQL